MRLAIRSTCFPDVWTNHAFPQGPQGEHSSQCECKWETQMQGLDHRFADRKLINSVERVQQSPAAFPRRQTQQCVAIPLPTDPSHVAHSP